MDTLQAKGNFSQHVGHLQLRDLLCCKRFAKLFALHCIVSCCVEAEFSSSHSSPGDSETCLVQAAERPFESFHIQNVFFWHFDIFKHDHASCRCSQWVLAFNFWSTDSWHWAAFKDVTTDVPLFVLCPDDKYFSVRGVSNPSFASIQQEMASFINCMCPHATWVRSCVWFSEPKATNCLPCC